MSDVVIRCPNCGTTGAALGECDACHEAERRYFCTNHTPGRWLDGPVCTACGARFGVERARPRPTPRPSPRSPARPAPPFDPPETLGTRRPPADEPAWTIEDILGGPSRAPHRAEVEGPGTRDPRFDAPAEPVVPPFGVRVIPVGGCVRRLVVLVLVLLALAALAFFGLLGVGSRILFGDASGAEQHSRATLAATSSLKHQAWPWDGAPTLLLNGQYHKEHHGCRAGCRSRVSSTAVGLPAVLPTPDAPAPRSSVATFC